MMMRPLHYAQHTCEVKLTEAFLNYDVIINLQINFKTN
jgi:hypothetical protein